ncbi:MAG: sugar ABC transporter permease [bacterium]|nr:sugar ABC transporter permease [bacterium]
MGEISTKKSFKPSKNVLFLIMVFPALIWFILIAYLPMFGLVLAFKRFHFYRGGFFESLLHSQWVGLENFYFLFTSHAAYIITRNTLLYNLSFIILTTVCSIAIAICLSELLNKRLAKFYQTFMFLPYFLSTIVVGYVLLSFLSVDKGSINHALMFFGMHPINWYSHPGYWPAILIIITLWKNIGYTSIFYLAAILAIGRHFYEAAELDGASKWQQIWNITIPHIKPIIIILVLIAIGNIFKADFGTFYWYPMNSGALFPATNVIDTYVFRGLMDSGNVGMTTAAGLYQSVMGLILIVSLNKLVKKFDSENAMF